MHTIRDYSLMCPNSTLMCAGHSPCGKRVKPACALMRSHMRRASRLVSLACAPSRYVLQTLLDAGYFEGSRSCVIRNAVAFDESRVRAAMERRKAGATDGPLKECYLGRLTEEKGFRVLLEAVAALAGDVVLHVAGAGPLEEEAARRGSEGMGVHLHGFLSQAQVDELVAACDVLCVPSVYAETFGRVVYDAYRNATTVVASDAGALREVVCRGAGTVVAAGDVAGLRDALAAYAANRRLVADEGCRGAASILCETVDRQVSLFEEALNSLL